MIIRTWIFLCIALFSHVTSNATTPPAGDKGTGVLVLTYHTGRNGERLDRVRFRLINEQKEQTMYPRTGTFYDKATPNVRRVTISDLPAGRYTVEFIAPNQDGLFGELPRREIVIASSDITKIDQAIKPHYARVSAAALLPDGYSFIGSGPTIRLCDSSGSCVASTYHGELVTNNLLPGKYILFFDAFMDFIPPAPIHFEVTPGAVMGPFERYYRRYGEVETAVADKNHRPSHRRQAEPVATPLEPLVHERASAVATATTATLAPTTGHNTFASDAGASHRSDDVPPEKWSLLYQLPDYKQPEVSLEDMPVPLPPKTTELKVEGKVRPGESLSIVVRSLDGSYRKKQVARAHDGNIHWNATAMPPGRYEVSIEAPDAYFAVPPQTVNIAAGESVTITPQLRTSRAIRVSTNNAKAEYTLTQTETGEQWHGTGRRHAFKRLAPGEYHLTFSATAGSQLVSPEEMTVLLSPDHDSYVNITYESTASK